MSRARRENCSSNPRVVLAANSTWYVVNFRSGLVRALSAAGFDPIIVAPADPACDERIHQLGVQHLAIDLSRSGRTRLPTLACF